MTRPEDKYVKIPAVIHATRIGYAYFPLASRTSATAHRPWTPPNRAKRRATARTSAPTVLASYDDIAAKKYSLSARQYFEVKIDYVDLTPEEFDAKLSEHRASLQEMFAEGERLQRSILDRLGTLRFNDGNSAKGVGHE